MSFFGFRFGHGKRLETDGQPGLGTASSSAGEETYYDVLGVSQNATTDEIRAAYRKMALDTHPDRHPDDPLATAKFIRVQRVYETLMDPGRRAAYDSQHSTLSSAGAYWNVTLHVTFSFSYYGYDIPLETMQQAERDAKRLADQNDINQAEAMAHLLLAPLISQTQRELRQRPRDVDLLLRLADLYFHTYRSFEALQYYYRAFELLPTWQTAARSEHLGRAFYYAGDYWGGVNNFARLLTTFPSAPKEVRQQWANEGTRLLSSAEAEVIKDATPEQKLEMKLSILVKKREFGYQPGYRDYKSIADIATEAGFSAVARDHLAMARGFHLEAYEVASLMRSHVRESLLTEAIALGELLLTPERLKKTLDNDEKRVCRALAEAYEKSGRDTDALVLYKKLSRYRDVSAALKRKVERLEARRGHEQVALRSGSSREEDTETRGQSYDNH